MADDIREDPVYQQNKMSMLGSNLKSHAWGIAGSIAMFAAVNLITGGTIALFSPLGLIVAGAAAAVGAFAAYKEWSSHKDEEALMADVTARRTISLQEERAQSVARMQDGSERGSANFAQTEQARRGIGASAGRTA